MEITFLFICGGTKIIQLAVTCSPKIHNIIHKDLTSCVMFLLCLCVCVEGFNSIMHAFQVNSHSYFDLSHGQAGPRTHQDQFLLELS